MVFLVPYLIGITTLEIYVILHIRFTPLIPQVGLGRLILRLMGGRIWRGSWISTLKGG